MEVEGPHFHQVCSIHKASFYLSVYGLKLVLPGPKAGSTVYAAEHLTARGITGHLRNPKLSTQEDPKAQASISGTSSPQWQT